MKTEEENTFRALQDNVALIPIRCKFGFHRWTKYTKDTIGGRRIVGDVFGRDHTYISHCADCNKPRVLSVFKAD